MHLQSLSVGWAVCTPLNKSTLLHLLKLCNLFATCLSGTTILLKPLLLLSVVLALAAPSFLVILTFLDSVQFDPVHADCLHHVADGAVRHLFLQYFAHVFRKDHIGWLGSLRHPIITPTLYDRRLLLPLLFQLLYTSHIIRVSHLVLLRHLQIARFISHLAPLNRQFLHSLFKSIVGVLLHLLVSFFHEEDVGTQFLSWHQIQGLNLVFQLFEVTRAADTWREEDGLGFDRYFWKFVQVTISVPPLLLFVG